MARDVRKITETEANHAEISLWVALDECVARRANLRRSVARVGRRRVDLRQAEGRSFASLDRGSQLGRSLAARQVSVSLRGGDILTRVFLGEVAPEEWGYSPARYSANAS